MGKYTLSPFCAANGVVSTNPLTDWFPDLVQVDPQDSVRWTSGDSDYWVKQLGPVVFGGISNTPFLWKTTGLNNDRDVASVVSTDAMREFTGTPYWDNVISEPTGDVVTVPPTPFQTFPNAPRVVNIVCTMLFCCVFFFLF